jgi:hypothetical protein
VRRALIVSLALIAFVASGCEEPNTTDYDPMGAAAASAGMELADVPVEQVASCVELTKIEAMEGDPAAQARWDAAGQSDILLSSACTELGRTDPAALATMHWDWKARG